MGSWRCNVAIFGVMMLAAVFVCVHSVSVARVKRGCPPLNNCELTCPSGYMRSGGCPICECLKRPVCPAKSCKFFCPDGYVSENGCPTCKCRKGD